MNIRYFQQGMRLQPDCDDVIDTWEIDRLAFESLNDGAKRIDYEGYTIFSNGVNPVCLTIHADEG